jgi:hypothetical protein
MRLDIASIGIPGKAIGHFDRGAKSMYNLRFSRFGVLLAAGGED